jgi:hypothetical protein
MGGRARAGAALSRRMEGIGAGQKVRVVGAAVSLGICIRYDTVIVGFSETFRGMRRDARGVLTRS